MIQPQTRLKVADNTGAKEIMCIRVMSGSAKRYAQVGDIIKATVKQAATYLWPGCPRTARTKLHEDHFASA